MGTIFTINGDGSGFQSVFSFNLMSGSVPSGGLCKAPNGLMYGFTNNGGANSLGSIFSFNPNGNVFNKIYDLTNALQGAASFILATDGKLYAALGGDSAGVVCIDPSSNNMTSFPFNSIATNPSFPYDTIAGPGNLISGNNGKLYGSTGSGGFTTTNSGGGGTIWNFDLTRHVYSLVYEYYGNSPTEAISPIGGNCLSPDGNIYGLAVSISLNSGSSSSTYFLYKLSTSGNYSALSNLTTFNGVSTIGFNNNLVAVNGNEVYGGLSAESANPNGVLFSLNTSTESVSNIFSFNEQTNGAPPFGGLMIASNGYIYGITYGGGTDSAGNNYIGTIYRINPVTNEVKIIYGFNLNDVLSGTSGDASYGNLIQY
jgi:hypothetical protein